jgi:hypothetical protein
MRIIQSFTKQDIVATSGKSLHTMSSKMANKAMTSAKEQIHIIIRQMERASKVDSHRHRSREERTFIKLHPVGIVVIGHGTLNYSQAFPSILYTANSVKDVSLLVLRTIKD